MDEDLITEIINDQHVTPEQAAYIANAMRAEITEFAAVWDASVWSAWVARLEQAAGIAVPWDLAARLAGVPVA